MEEENHVISSVLFPDISVFEVESDEEEEVAETLSPWALSKIGTFQYRLEELIRYREQRRGKSVSMSQISTSVILRLANDVFGFNGWSSNLLECLTVEQDFDEENSEYSMTHRAHVLVKLQDGSISAATGVGISRRMPHKYLCLQYSKKMAVTNGLRNAILNFTNLIFPETEVKTEVKLELGDWEGQ
ncbi:CIC11C00000002643 [Sungouiella intermedia]|uniref:DNA repair and recombination protein RAD52 n=1 Tax=Sungouiella intermedia TaxID=45354 RepID=A0A1L0BT94_9ASCO|nr:CIC11C00000002643 [[Candida] intermedia]